MTRYTHMKADERQEEKEERELIQHFYDQLVMPGQKMKSTLDQLRGLNQALFDGILNHDIPHKIIHNSLPRGMVKMEFIVFSSLIWN